MQSSRSLRARAVLALLLMVGYYLFALTIAGVLLWVPYAEVTYVHRVNGQLTVFCVVGGLTILWSLLPRVDKFDPPGPQLTPSTAPDLFAMINDVAKATSQPRPEEVYLLPDVNAFVAQRGGMMGIGSKRVMGIGLPLVKGLSPSQLRSVIAHEFGHYVSGDVALGPWIYKTRAAIARTLHGLRTNWILSRVFSWYARLFMRMTMQVSREQEFVADATAARVAGAESALTALQRVEILAPAYSAYMNSEVMPVLQAGYLPPVSAGFEQYIGDPDTEKLFREFAGKSSASESGEFDSHPPTSARIAALQLLKPHRRLGNSQSPLTEPAAQSSTNLLRDPDRHARVLLEHNFGRDTVVKLKPIDWSDVGAKVYAGIWQQQVKEHSQVIGSMTADQIPADKKWFLTKGGELAKENADAMDADFRAAFSAHVFGCAIGVALLNRGWQLETTLGKPIVFVNNGAHFNPRDAVARLADGAISADEWKAECDRLGLTGAPLAP